MASKTWPILVAAVIAILSTGCSERRENPMYPDVHPASWMDPDSPDFHGARVLAVGTDFCAGCHGQDASGGTRAVACSDCHEESRSGCVDCHGGLDNETGAPPYDLSGNSDIASIGVGAHTLHLEGEGGFAGFECDACHLVPSTQYSPGHQDSPLPAEVTLNEAVTNRFYPATWDRASGTCTGVICHGASHTTPVWTEEAEFACTDCHGNPLREREEGQEFDPGPAPPFDLGGNFVTSARGVGAHESHVLTGPLRVGIDCDECHIKPQRVEDEGHIDGNPPFQAEIVWGDLADLDGDTTTTPVYIEGDNPRCSDTYCHGGRFVQEDRGFMTEPTWTIVDGSQTACGACHKIPPHDDFGLGCDACHGSVVNPDTTISESGKSLHINGEINF